MNNQQKIEEYLELWEQIENSSGRCDIYCYSCEQILSADWEQQVLANTENINVNV